jgi:hypothetical protein
MITSGAVELLAELGLSAPSSDHTVNLPAALATAALQLAYREGRSRNVTARQDNRNILY